MHCSMSSYTSSASVILCSNYIVLMVIIHTHQFLIASISVCLTIKRRTKDARCQKWWRPEAQKVYPEMYKQWRASCLLNTGVKKHKILTWVKKIMHVVLIANASIYFNNVIMMVDWVVEITNNFSGQDCRDLVFYIKSYIFSNW